NYHTSTQPPHLINAKNILQLKNFNITHPGHIYSMSLSQDGSLLATCSTLGTVRIFNTSTGELIQELRDENETQIEEYYVVKFTPDDKYIITGGKRKDRYK